MTKELRDRRLEDHKAWYCPNGHSQSYTGKTEAEKLRERLERVEIQRDHAREEAERQKRIAAAAKGQATKAKNRAAKGVCPHPDCKRSFVDVARHVATKHPELVEA
jgi:septal ring factor EnvC (AmiA/AmiB activator)